MSQGFAPWGHCPKVQSCIVWMDLKKEQETQNCEICILKKNCIKFWNLYKICIFDGLTGQTIELFLMTRANAFVSENLRILLWIFLFRITFPSYSAFTGIWTFWKGYKFFFLILFSSNSNDGLILSCRKSLVFQYFNIIFQYYFSILFFNIISLSILFSSNLNDGLILSCRNSLVFQYYFSILLFFNIIIFQYYYFSILLVFQYYFLQTWTMVLSSLAGIVSSFNIIF